MDQLSARFEASLAKGMTLAVRIIEQYARRREQLNRAASQRSRMNRERYLARIAAQQAGARTEISQIYHPRWWESATANQVVRLWALTQTFTGQPWAREAESEIERRLKETRGINLTDLTERNQAINRYYTSVQNRVAAITAAAYLTDQTLEQQDDQFIDQETITDTGDKIGDQLTDSEITSFAASIETADEIEIWTQLNQTLAEHFGPEAEPGTPADPGLETASMEQAGVSQEVSETLQVVATGEIPTVADTPIWDSDERRRAEYDELVEFGVDPQVAQARYLADVANSLPVNQIAPHQRGAASKSRPPFGLDGPNRSVGERER